MPSGPMNGIATETIFSSNGTTPVDVKIMNVPEIAEVEQMPLTISTRLGILNCLNRKLSTESEY